MGSDYPHGTLQEAMEHLRRLNSDDATKRKVAGDNDGALHGIPG